jgi:hypothetical protein
MITNQEYWETYKCIHSTFWEHNFIVTVPEDIMKNKRIIYISKIARTWHPEKVHEYIFEVNEGQLITDTILDIICKTYKLSFSLYYGKNKNLIMFHPKFIDKSAMYYYENNPNNENYNPNDH